MESVEFTIECDYKGWDYTGRVTYNDTHFSVYYSLDTSPLFEKLVEITEVVTEGTNPLSWEEVSDEVRIKKTDRALIQAIGEALEDREVL